MIADRYGSAQVIAGGLVFYALGLFFMAQAHTAMAFVLSAGCVSASPCRALHSARSIAIGGLGQFAMVPAAQALIGGWDWTSALLVLAVLMALLLPLAFPMRDQSVSSALTGTEPSMRAAIGEAFRHRGFWLLNLGFLACGFQLAFIATHLPAYLLDRGLAASDAVAALAIIALTNIAGTYLLGLWDGTLRRKYLLAGLYLTRTAPTALFVLLPLSTWSVYLFAAVMGFLWLGTVPLTNGLVSQIFGVRYITTLFGFVFFGHQLGSFFGVWLGGRVFEATGSYQGIWLLAIALGLLATILHWPIDDRAIVRIDPRPATP